MLLPFKVLAWCLAMRLFCFGDRPKRIWPAAIGVGTCLTLIDAAAQSTSRGDFVWLWLLHAALSYLAILAFTRLDGLLGALAFYGLDAMAAAEKTTMSNPGRSLYVW